MTPADLTEHYCHAAQAAYWQGLLRRTVRLRLGLLEPTVRQREVLADLRLLELCLRWHLRQSDAASAASPEAEATADAVVQMYQMALLSHRAECEALQRAQPLTRYHWQVPLKRPRRVASGCGYLLVA